MASVEETLIDKQLITGITAGTKKVQRTVRRTGAKVNKHLKSAQKAFDTVFPPPKQRGRRVK